MDLPRDCPDGAVVCDGWVEHGICAGGPHEPGPEWDEAASDERHQNRGPDAPVERGDAAFLALLVLLVLIQNEPVTWLAGLYAAVGMLIVGWMAWPGKWRR